MCLFHLDMNSKNSHSVCIYENIPSLQSQEQSWKPTTWFTETLLLKIWRDSKNHQKEKSSNMWSFSREKLRKCRTSGNSGCTITSSSCTSKYENLGISVSLGYSPDTLGTSGRENTVWCKATSGSNKFQSDGYVRCSTYCTHTVHYIQMAWSLIPKVAKVLVNLSKQKTETFRKLKSWSHEKNVCERVVKIAYIKNYIYRYEDHSNSTNTSEEPLFSTRDQH